MTLSVFHNKTCTSSLIHRGTAGCVLEAAQTNSTQSVRCTLYLCTEKQEGTFSGQGVRTHRSILRGNAG